MLSSLSSQGFTGKTAAYKSRVNFLRYTVALVPRPFRAQAKRKFGFV